jgi:hypothetical protein
MPAEGSDNDHPDSPEPQGIPALIDAYKKEQEANRKQEERENHRIQ